MRYRKGKRAVERKFPRTNYARFVEDCHKECYEETLLQYATSIQKNTLLRKEVKSVRGGGCNQSEQKINKSLFFSVLHSIGDSVTRCDGGEDK